LVYPEGSCPVEWTAVNVTVRRGARASTVLWSLRVLDEMAKERERKSEVGDSCQHRCTVILLRIGYDRMYSVYYMLRYTRHTSRWLSA
jgi:hypothetical protein